MKIEIEVSDICLKDSRTEKAAFSFKIESYDLLLNSPAAHIQVQAQMKDVCRYIDKHIQHIMHYARKMSSSSTETIKNVNLNENVYFLKLHDI